MENIQIQVVGGGTAEEAAVKLPEKEAAYPENNMFGKIMTSYGIYARHIRGVTFTNVVTFTAVPDARPARGSSTSEGKVPLASGFG